MRGYSDDSGLQSPCQTVSHLMTPCTDKQPAGFQIRHAKHSSHNSHFRFYFILLKWQLKNKTVTILNIYKYKNITKTLNSYLLLYIFYKCNARKILKAKLWNVLTKMTLNALIFPSKRILNIFLYSPITNIQLHWLNLDSVFQFH